MDGGPKEGPPTPKVISAWERALTICPYCAGDGCYWCGYTGDRFKHLMDQARRAGLREAMWRMRQATEELKKGIEEAEGAADDDQ